MRPDDQLLINQVKRREMLQPLRYDSSFGPAISAEAFDRLKEAYLAKESEVQAVRTALGNFNDLLASKIIKETDYASSEGEVESSYFSKHQDGDQSRKAAEASGGDSSVRGGESSPEEFTSYSQSAGALIQELNENRVSWSEGQGRFVPAPYNFRVDDVMLMSDLGVEMSAHNQQAVDKMKWDRSFEDSKLSVCNLDDLDGKTRDYEGLFKPGYGPSGPPHHDYAVRPGMTPNCE